jgi:hypothetical protein
MEQLRTGRQRKASTTGRPALKRRLSAAEKQIIHAVAGNPEVATPLGDFLVNDFLNDVWSGPVIEKLIRNPGLDIERAMDDLGDTDLEQAVRAAVMEPYGTVSLEMAVVSMGCLYEEYLSKEERQLQEQFRQCTGPAPTELLERKMQILKQKTQLRQIH